MIDYKHILAIVFLLCSASISAQPCFEICSGESVTLSHDVPGATVTWYDVNSTLIGVGDQVVTPTASTSYYCIAINDTDCSYTEPLYCTVIVNEPFLGDIPTEFTPNGDGIDDEWCPELLCLDNLEIKIFSSGRGAQLVFHTNTIGDCWDGSGLGSSTFQVEITSTQFNFTGFITLLP